MEFAAGKDFDERTSVAVKFDELNDAVKEEGLEDEYQSLLDSIEEKIKTDKKRTLMLKKEELKNILEFEIVGKYYYTAGQTEYSLRNDTQLNEILDKVDFSVLTAGN